MPKKIPQRMCIACRQMKDKKDLLRIVKNSSGDIFVDTTNKANGRGAYICNSKGCFDKCIKTKALNRAFKCEIDAEVVANLQASLKD